MHPSRRSWRRNQYLDEAEKLMKTRAFLIGFVVILFWLAPSPNQTQAPMPKREPTKMVSFAATTQPAHFAK